MSLVVFEDEDWRNFQPLTYTRHVSELCWGTRTLLESLTEVTRRSQPVLWGREYLGKFVTERLGAKYNSKHESGAVLVNARARPTDELRRLAAKEGVAVFSNGSLVLATPKRGPTVQGLISRSEAVKLSKGLERLEGPPGMLFENYWDLVESNGSAISAQASTAGWLELPPKNVSLKGPASNLRIDPSAEIEEYVAFNTVGGPVIVGEGAHVESFSKLSGPCFVGRWSRIHSSLIRSGTSIFEQCRIGGEVENSIIMSFTNKSHHGYIGDTIVGEWVNLGAGSTFSNLKNTYGTVRVSMGRNRIDSMKLKLGPIIGDMAKVSIGAMVFAGKRVGVSSHLVGIVSKDVPSFTYHDGNKGRSVELKLESVIETQRRMKERRGRAMTKAEEDMIKYLFGATSQERRSAAVRSGRIV